MYWLKAPFTSGGKTYEAGTIYVPAKPTTKALVEKLAAELGIDVRRDRRQADGRRAEAEPGAHRAVGSVRRVDAVGLDPLDLRADPPGEVRRRLPAGARCGQPHAEVRRAHLPGRRDSRRRPARRPAEGGRGGDVPPAAAAAAGAGGQAGPSNIPAEYQGRQGRVTAETTIPMLKKFVEDGGTIITIGIVGQHRRRTSACPSASGLVEIGERRRAPAAERQVLRAGLGAVDGRRPGATRSPTASTPRST